MHALLLKDFFMIIKQMRLFIVIIIIFSIIPSPFLTPLAVLYSVMLPITVLSYDERSKWDELAVMMPYSINKLVFSKYLLGYIAIFSSSILTILSQLIVSVINQTAINSDTIYSTLFIIGSSLIILAINMPFMFRLGVEKGRLLFIVFIILFLLGKGFIADKISYNFFASLNNFTSIVILSIIVIIINIFSLQLSTLWYRREKNS